jgi:hypothetical protein
MCVSFYSRVRSQRSGTYSSVGSCNSLTVIMSLQLRIDTTTRHLGSSRLLSPGASCSARSHTRNGSASSVASTLSVVSPPSSSTNASSTSLPLRRSPSPEYTVDPDADLALALHDFEPENVNSTCLSFKIRQIIVVHNRDPSGWWDGEILGSRGQRGWFPSNYVREYSVPELEADLKVRTAQANFSHTVNFNSRFLASEPRTCESNFASSVV